MNLSFFESFMFIHREWNIKINIYRIKYKYIWQHRYICDILLIVLLLLLLKKLKYHWNNKIIFEILSLILLIVDSCFEKNNHFYRHWDYWLIFSHYIFDKLLRVFLSLKFCHIRQLFKFNLLTKLYTWKKI